ncbi:LytR/AlgR family response regulator transcription factor [Taibaiella soli]|uniref:DNA-binding response regulator n=1 Tax=Taibaiella soli TaxID=1649169 RepID=A0A2W2AI33_9BACT|nr:response regulator [Taibaiella soli]PZF74921.1 hypothetical protein DN068_01615 [Taibaiella soli]
MKILILEDEAIIAESLFQLLESMNYQPMDAVATPDEAIALLNEEHPGLVIMDIRLGKGRSGLEVADYINTHYSKLPFIVLTAHSDKATIQEVKRFRPAAYLTKPFVKETLFAAIELALPEHTEEPAPAPKPTIQPETREEPLFIKIGGRYEKVEIKHILYLQAKGKYTEIHLPYAKYLMRMPLTSFAAAYPQINWVRIHKSFFVNASYVTSITGKEITVQESKLPIGRAYQAEVMQRFNAV